MPLSFTIAGNTIVQLVGKFITAGITFLITLVIAYYYGAFGYGEFTKMMAFVSLFYLIADFGLNAVWLKERGGDHHMPFAVLLLTRLIWSGALVLVALVVLVFLPFDPVSGDGFNSLVKMGSILLLPTIVTQALFVSYNALFQKALRYDRSVLASGIGSVVTIALVYLASRARLPVSVLVVSYTVGGIVLALAGGILAKRFGDHAHLFTKQVRSGSWRLLTLSLPLGISLVMSLIHFKADIVILTLYRTTIEVGTYGLATKFFEFMLTIPIFYMNAVYPLLLNSKFETRNSKLRMHSMYILLGLSLVFMIGGFFLAPYITLIKDEFAESVVSLRLLLISLPLFFISALYMWIVIATGARWVLVWIYGASMIVNIGLNLIFIPRYGAPAAAITTGVSEAVILLLLFINYPAALHVAKKSDV